MDYASAAFHAIDEALPGQPADLIRLYALLALVKGEAVTLADVHDAWSLWRITTNAHHPALVPFGELAPSTQELDRPYADAIRATALRLGVSDPSDEWRKYTIEPGGVVCRSDGACEWSENADVGYRVSGYYLTLGEAVDSARAHVALHRQDPETLP